MTIALCIIWYFAGGWWLFLLVALISTIWLLYDSGKRQLQATGWRIASVLMTALMLPTIMIFMADTLDAFLSLILYWDLIFFLGVIGSILSFVISVAYFVTFQGQTGYEPPVQGGPVVIERSPTPERAKVKQRKQKEKVNAWLITRDGRNYQINAGRTSIGRSSRNDIKIEGDGTVSGQHARIEEQNFHFSLIDMGSTNGTRVNGHRVQGPMLLHPDDEIQLGDNSHLQFVTSKR